MTPVLPDGGLQGNHKPMAENEEEEDENEEGHLGLGATSVCPSCRRGFDVALLLPCSHTLCGRCVMAGEGARKCPALRGATRSPSTPYVSPYGCAVLCPCCRHPVDLPCWDWASATCSLPVNPTLTPGWTASRAQDQARGGIQKASSQDNTSNMDLEGVTDQNMYDSPLEGAIDLQEDEMEQSVSGLRFNLNPSTAGPLLHFSTDSLTVTFLGPSPVPLSSHHHRNKVTGSVTRPESLKSDPNPFPQMCADVVIVRGQFYWEVDVCNSNLYRIGVTSLDNARGWWLERRGMSFSVVYDWRREPLCAVPPHIKTLGLFLNMGGGTLSFHNPITQEHVVTLPTRFSPTGVCPALGLGQGRLRFRCGLPPPAHVFLSHTSTYRGPSGAGGGRWSRDVPFQSIRRVIQRFEDLTVSDSDSRLGSSFGGSCSTLASLPQPGLSFCLSPAGAFHCGQKSGEEGKDNVR